MPFVKGLILSDLTEGVEVFKYISPDIKFKIQTSDSVGFNGLRAAMNLLYTDFKN